MKKKILAVSLGVCAAGLLMGCSSELSNEYVTVKQYKGLEVAQVETTEVTDDMVESEISSRLSASATTEEITDRAAEDGDTVNIDYSGSIDGVQFDGGTASGQDVEIGSGYMIGANGDYKGFEEQLIGHSIGEEFVIRVKFPDEYQMSSDLSGKVADFTIKLNSISKATTPELTNKWVKKNSDESKTVAEYKKEVKADLEEQYEESTNQTLQSEVLQALLDNTEVKKYPKDELKETKEEMNSYYKEMASQYGMEFEDFLSTYMGITEDEFKEQVESVAKDSLKQKLAIGLVAKKKNLEPTDKEYEERFEEYAEMYNFDSVDDMKEQAGEDVLKEMVLRERVAEYLVKSCVQVEESDDTTDTSTESTDSSDSSSSN